MKLAIAGAGKLGNKIAETLNGGNYEITIIDRDASRLDKLSQNLDVLTVNADARKRSVLQEIGIEDYEFLIAVTGSDDTNMVISRFAGELGCPHIITRIREPENIDQLDFIRNTMYIDHIVNPDMQITVEIYKYLAEKYTLQNGIFTTGDAALIEFAAKTSPQLIGLSMPQFRALRPNFLIVAVSREGKLFIPHGSTVLQETDTIYMLGQSREIQSFRAALRNGKNRSLRNIMIVGGGNTGYYLAQKLQAFGANVKLVERDLERCHTLSTELRNVMVLHSDGTDPDFLEEENLSGMDAFVAATGYDEENLLLALTATKHSVPDVIAKVSHGNYIGLIEQMGINMVLNPIDIAVSRITEILQGPKRVISSVLLQGQAQLMEIVADDTMKFLNTPIAALNIPESILICAIRRREQTIIPNGTTRIERGDRVILLCLLSNLSDVETLLKSKKR